MTQISKPMLLAIASALSLLLKKVFGVDITHTEQEVFVDGTLAAVAVISVIVDRVKAKK